jgi:hydroxymethylglutaryl-CoA reductase (NADPH)
MSIPSLILRQLYTFGSLRSSPEGTGFALKNRVSPARLQGVVRLEIDGAEIPLERVTLLPDGAQAIRLEALTPGAPIEFPLKRQLEVHIEGLSLAAGRHRIDFTFEADPFGRLALGVVDAVTEPIKDRVSVPYDKDDDTSPAIVEARQRFVERFSGVPVRHLWHYSIDPPVTRGRIEGFTGVAQIPLAFCGPRRVNGEHASGNFLIPLATVEGTLTASYNRGMKVINLSGGVSCTVADDCMQRAPVFAFDSAREARDFRDWVEGHLAEIREVAESTSHVARLRDVEAYLSNNFAFLRFNYTTGDAAGQNMVGRATFAACGWILDRVPGIRKFYLESNLATDKKASQINTMRTRGKRVTAEVTIPRKVAVQQLRIEPETLAEHYAISTLGAFLSGANNNGAHSANAVTALFIATGQDVANVAESSAGILFCRATPEGDLYLSLTIPSLIVATRGGGTGLPTQRECLEILGCHGDGKVNRFAEIVAGVALAGEISLGAAISSLDWVSSHEKYGRNR